MNKKIVQARRYRSARTLLSLPLATALILTGPTVMAEPADFNRFGVSIGAFITERDSKTRLDGSISDPGTPIDLESDLGLDKSGTVFRFDGYYRFSEKHRLDVSIFDLSRSSSRQIETEIEWDDVIYPIDTVVSSNFDLQIYKLAYTWSFMRRDKGYLGLTAGLYVADIGTRLAVESLGSRSGNGVTAPLPVVGLRGEYDFAEKWTFRSSAEVFALEYGDYSGSLVDLYAGVDYELRDRISVGLGFNGVKLNVGVSKPNFNGDLDWRYSGGLLSLRFDF